MLKRRDLLQWIGASAGTAAMYQAMASIGLAGASSYRGRLRLEGESRNASVLILGAGLAGLVAGLELRKAGYKVQILEYRDRAGDRKSVV